MGVINGQAVSAEITNPAFLDANADDTALGKITLANTDSASGATINNIQQEHNAIASYTGMTVNSPIDITPTWTASELGSPTDTLRDRANSITQAFQSATGHAHSGAIGDGGLITGASIQNVPLRGYVNQGTTYSALISTSSTNITALMAGKTSGGGVTALGVVTDAPNNKTVIRYASGASTGDSIKDALGNIVYGRVTEAAGVWTHSYYVDLAGTETAYSMTATTSIAWYYQEIFDPLVSAPVFSEFAMIPSDNVTADIQTATTTLQGRVSLSATAPGAIASTGAAGTANASTANADHTHEGLHSIRSSGGAQILGDAIIAGSNGATVTQASSTITVDAPALSSTTPGDVNSTASVGTGTTSARADHVHKGMHSFAKSGSTALFGDVTISGSNGTTLTQAAQNIAIDSPALSSTAPTDIASSASVGTGTTSARADHVHRGVASMAKSGSTSLYGDVTLTGTGGTTLTQASQNIAVDSPALSSTAPADIGSSASVGTGTTSARADHVHRGVSSLAKNGSTALYGAVTLSAGTNVTLTQVGNDISIASSGGGGGGGTNALPAGSAISGTYTSSVYVAGDCTITGTLLIYGDLIVYGDAVCTGNFAITVEGDFICESADLYGNRSTSVTVAGDFIARSTKTKTTTVSIGSGTAGAGTLDSASNGGDFGAFDFGAFNLGTTNFNNWTNSIAYTNSNTMVTVQAVQLLFVLTLTSGPDNGVSYTFTPTSATPGLDDGTVTGDFAGANFTAGNTYTVTIQTVTTYGLMAKPTTLTAGSSTAFLTCQDLRVQGLIDFSPLWAVMTVATRVDAAFAQVRVLNDLSASENIQLSGGYGTGGAPAQLVIHNDALTNSIIANGADSNFSALSTSQGSTVTVGGHLGSTAVSVFLNGGSGLTANVAGTRGGTLRVYGSAVLSSATANGGTGSGSGAGGIGGIVQIINGDIVTISVAGGSSTTGTKGGPGQFVITRTKVDSITAQEGSSGTATALTSNCFFSATCNVGTLTTSTLVSKRSSGNTTLRVNSFVGDGILFGTAASTASQIGISANRTYFYNLTSGRWEFIASANA